jgi:hypothetical protein
MKDRCEWQHWHAFIFTLISFITPTDIFSRNFFHFLNNSKHEENSMPPNKKPRLNMDWFDDVVLVATEGPKFTKTEIVANEVTRYASEPSSTVFSTVMEVCM